MALTEERLNDKIEVVKLDAGYPAIHVRTAVIIKRDDIEIDRIFHRHVLMPNSDLTNEDADVVAIASTVFTEEAKAAYAEQETP
jgi:L-fucose mutarotase/ribose pyranase (RbsD/FucU family)